jgi:hypothetical protein
MYGIGIKIIESKQTKICTYKNAKLKLRKTNAAICFNEISETKQLNITKTALICLCNLAGTDYELPVDDATVSKHVAAL